MRALWVWPVLLLASRAAGQIISFNRTAGEVEVGTCEGLKKNVELGVDISVVVTANLRCSETITVPQGVHISVGSAADESYLVAIAEDFASPDPTSVTLLVNPEGSHLSLDRLTFANEAGSAGSPGASRAVWNQGSLEVNGCYFVGLNFASLQDGGAVSFVVCCVARSVVVLFCDRLFGGLLLPLGTYDTSRDMACTAVGMNVVRILLQCSPDPCIGFFYVWMHLL